MILEFSRQISEKNSNMKFHEDPSSGSRAVPRGQAEKHTTVLTVASHNFAYASKGCEVTVKFLCNKTNSMHQFHKFILSRNSTCFGQFFCLSSAVYSLYTQQWCMSYSCRAGPGWNCSTILVLLDSCLQTCMTYTIAECTVNKVLMIDRRTVRNM